MRKKKKTEENLWSLFSLQLRKAHLMYSLRMQAISLRDSSELKIAKHEINNKCEGKGSSDDITKEEKEEIIKLRQGRKKI